VTLQALDNLSYAMNLVGVIIQWIKIKLIRFCTETDTHRDTIFEHSYQRAKKPLRL